eukprot:2254054-Rhodomonas_salina.1
MVLSVYVRVMRCLVLTCRVILPAHARHTQPSTDTACGQLCYQVTGHQGRSVRRGPWRCTAA